MVTAQIFDFCVVQNIGIGQTNCLCLVSQISICVWSLDMGSFSNRLLGWKRNRFKLHTSITKLGVKANIWPLHIKQNNVTQVIYGHEMVNKGASMLAVDVFTCQRNWPSNVMYRVMACCLGTPSHYANQY